MRSLSLACALENDSTVPTDSLCNAIYRHTTFVIVLHSSMLARLTLKMLWNPHQRHFLKEKKKTVRNDPSFREDPSSHPLLAQHLDLET